MEYSFKAIMGEEKPPKYNGTRWKCRKCGKMVDGDLYEEPGQFGCEKPSESDMVPAVERFLASAGYFVYRDRYDLFDIAALMGDIDNHTLLCVELKLAAPKAVYEQAIERTAYSDMVAVAMPKERSLRTVEKHAEGHEKGHHIGLLLVDGNDTRWLREPTPHGYPIDVLRDRLAGTMLAIRGGYIEKAPSRTFIEYATRTYCGKPLHKFTEGWPLKLRAMVRGLPPCLDRQQTELQSFTEAPPCP